MSQNKHSRAPSAGDSLIPKLFTAIREGYGGADLMRDAVAGLTVAVVALPLSMAIGIASGASPAQGIVTAIVAGFLISFFGGSRFQVGGPTAAFIVVVFATIERHGYDGMLLATLLAAVMLVALGVLRLGSYIKYIPYPVVTGFTAGIAVSIFVSQIKDLLGLDVKLPGEFVEKIEALWHALPGTNFQAVAVALIALGIIVALRIARPKWPGFLIALVFASGVAIVLGLDVATIGSTFGEIPRSLPSPQLPTFSIEKLQAVLPDAITIALLAGIESLLSAVVADGMTGRRHRSNVELVAQGIANFGSVLFAGLPATGAIARTATNIRAGARTPVAGILHAVFLLLFVLIAAPVLSYVPLAALAAILAYVAWNISEIGHIKTIMRSASNGDRFVLAGTFLLTVFVDLTVGIQFGVVAAAIVFMHRMANVVRFEESTLEDDEDTEGFDQENNRVIVYRINGPFFFGASQRFASILDRIGEAPRAYVLDMSDVPLIDSTAVSTLGGFIAKANGQQIEVILAGASPDVRRMLERFHVGGPMVRFAPSVEVARKRADRDIAQS